MLIRHFMTTDVFTLSTELTALEAFEEMKRRGIRRAPVLEEGEMVGIVSESDLIYILPGTAAQVMTEAGEASMEIPVRDVMSTGVRTVHPDDHLGSAAQNMLKYKIGGIPVVEKGKLVGIITESDVFKAVWGVLTPEKGASVVFEEDFESGTDSARYLEVCLKHKCNVQTLLRYDAPDGGNIYYISLSGEPPEAFFEEVTAAAKKVFEIEKSGAGQG